MRRDIITAIDKMEITKTFVNTFSYMLRAKWRWFIRRSVFRYAVAVAILTYATHRENALLRPIDYLERGLIYFVGLSVVVLVLNVLAAKIQSQQSYRREVTFTEKTVLENLDGKPTTRGWEWILSAEDSQDILSLYVKEPPKLELYLPKNKLKDHEYNTLRSWLITHGKLKLKEGMA